MSAYGNNNYARPAYGADGGDNGGGFFGGSQGGSQGAGRGLSEESLRPVTIKQIIDAEQAYPDAPFRIDSLDVSQVTFVGQVRNVSPQTTNITFRLDDGTGIIEVKQWIDADKQDDSKPSFELDQYVRVWGRLKSFNNKRHVGAHVIKPIADFNEVNYHLLEATYVHLFFTKGAPGGEGAGGAKANAGDNDSMFVDGGDGGYGANDNDSKVAHLSAKAKRFYNYLKHAEGGSEGIRIEQIASGVNMSVQDAAAAAEELIGPGVIYTTMDDETYAILDY
ncbi:hypothetical protein BKA67DRAFT_529510 [Truncatella angustata]|uniref:Replication protein A 32 kDa subunit n=1 Tax=Truncatella angustata TaxID=152316 RepID=A0A9P8UWB0_9PEZI|nr:uncharacterized protein BKA67DRAFT_529510 [Truncatella angustata]KAH6659355.1 hypothetical protein BKA67DRAFT_529510 [Truncatella angustata]KAH8199137.1 hypothetical protein TruAng_006668 [Truncatella angustata]